MFNKILIYENVCKEFNTINRIETDYSEMNVKMTNIFWRQI